MRLSFYAYTHCLYLSRTLKRNGEKKGLWWSENIIFLQIGGKITSKDVIFYTYIPRQLFMNNDHLEFLHHLGQETKLKPPFPLNVNHFRK